MTDKPKPKALVVDDERVIADTLAIILNQSGFDAKAVYSGTGAVEAAKQSKPNLIITDVIMPDMNGIDVAIAVRELVPSCEVLLLSGQAATADLMRKATAAGHCFDLLSKPIPPDELLRHVARRLPRL